MIHARLWQLARQVPGALLLAVLAGLAISALSVTQALLVAAAVTDIFRGGWDRVIVLLYAAIALILARSLLTAARTVLTAWIAARVRRRLRNVLLQQLAAVGPDGVTERRAGIVRSTLTEGVDSLSSYYSVYLPQLIVSTLVPTGVVIGMCTVYGPAGALVAGAVLLAWVVPRLKDRQLVYEGRLRWDVHYDLAADYLEAMHAMGTLRSFGADGRRRDLLEKRSQLLYRSTMRELKVSLVENGFTAFVVQVGMAAAVTSTAAAVASITGAGSAATQPATAVIVLVSVLAVECFRPIKDLSSAWHAGYLGVTAIDGIDEILGAPVPVPDTGTAQAPWTSSAPQIEVRGVTVRYPGAQRAALQNADLRLPAGALTGIIGPSGAGKSTLGKLLLRLRDPDGGAVLADGVDLREISLQSLRSSGLAAVEQHPFLLAGSVRSNLLLARPDAGDDELAEALRSAGAERFVAALPGGIDEPLEEDGGNLSGGQRQRLALARALLAQPKVLVLDEATSHLDEDTAQQVTDALLGLRGRCTTVMILHRMSTALACDHVVVLDQGHVVQSGSPADLARLPGMFADQLRAQQGTARSAGQQDLAVAARSGRQVSS